MKVVEKIKVSIFFMGLFSGGCALPILILGFPRLWEAFRTDRLDGPTFLIILALASLMLGFLLTAWLLIRLIRVIVLPVREAADFANRLAGGEVPQQLPVRERANDEVNTLYSALNFLRDRQQNLSSRLKLSVSHEAGLRRNAESYGTLQLKILTRMIPEMGTPLGEIKGFSRILLLDLESENPNREEMQRLLREIGHRVGSISRQMERLLDITHLDRGRWERFEVSEFRTAEFLRELIVSNSIPMQEREVVLVNHFSASAPELLMLDRELLFQLMVLLIRAVGRAASPGETVVLSCYKEEGKVVFEVRDSRNKPFRENIVDAYNAHVRQESSLENATVQVLGLIFSADLATKLGGDLLVLSTENAHALLRVTLPENCAVSEQHHGQSQYHQHNALPALFSGKEPDLSSRVRVLYGTEVTEGPYILRRLLEPYNIEFTCVGDADELRRKLAEESFDCVVLSGSLKVSDFPAMIEELRAIRGYELPVVVIAGSLPAGEQRRLHNMHRVFPMNSSLNFALLGRLIRETATPAKGQ